MKFYSVAACCAVLAAACAPKSPAPDVQCARDADCFSGGVCIAGGTCRLGQPVDPAKSTVEVSQQQATADGLDKVTITVTLEDAAGNGLPSRTVQLSVDGAGTLTQPALATDAEGRVTGTLVSTRAGLKTLHAIASATGMAGLQLAASPAVTFVADANHLAPLGTSAGASSISVTAEAGGTPDVVADGVAKVLVKAKIVDANGNPLVNLPVFVDASGGANTVGPAGTTAADGTFSGFVQSTRAEAKTVIVSAGSLHASVPVTFHAGPAAAAPHTLVVSDAASIPATGGTVAHIDVLARDQFDNVIPAAPVSVSWDTQDATQVGITIEPTAQSSNPALTAPDGTLTLAFSSPRAGKKNLTVHVEGVAVQLPAITVTPGAPDASLSQFVVLGNADGSPVVADAASAYILGVYVADAQDNPIAGASVSFRSSEPSDVLQPTGDSPANVTGADGTCAWALGARLAGDRVIDATFGPGFTGSSTVTFAPGAPAAASSTLTVSPAAVSTDGAKATITAVLRDQFGNETPNQDVTIDATGSNNVFTLPTNTGGTYTADLQSSTAEPKTVTLDVQVDATHTVHLEQPVTFTPGAVSASTSTLVATDTQPVTANGSATAHALLTLRDGQGNPIAGLAPAATVTPSTGVALAPIAAGAAPGTYVVAFTSTRAGTRTLSVSVGAVAIAQVAQLTFAADSPSAARSSLVVSPSSIVAGSTIPATVTLAVSDGQGNPVNNAQFTLQSSAPGTFTPGAAVTTDANGSATVSYASTVAGAQTLKATSGSVVLSGNLSVVPGNASQANSSIAFNPASAVADGVAPIVVAVTEKDASQNPIVGHSVVVSCVPAVCGAPAQTTDSNGKIAVTLTSRVAGPVTVTATDTTAGGAFQSGSITFTPGAPSAANTTFTASPTSVVADNATLVTLTAVVLDAQKNAVPNVAVSFSGSDLHDTVACAASPCVTDASGKITGTVRSSKSGSQTLSAAVQTIAAPCTAPVTFTPGAAAMLSFDTQPADAQAGAPMASVAVRLLDQFGNAVPTAQANVSLALVGGPGTLNGGASQAAVAGVAKFNALNVTGGAGPRQLVASATGLAGATSNAFVVHAPNESTGVNGAFAPAGSVSLPSGLYNYTTITIPAGVVISSDGTGVLEMRAQGDVAIDGVVNVSGAAGGSVSGGVNGGGAGGAEGAYASAGAAGQSFGGAGTAAAGGNAGAAAAETGAAGEGLLAGRGGGAAGGGGGGGGSDGNADMDSGGGGGGGGVAGGAGGFGGADGCVAAGGRGGGQWGGGTTACGAVAGGGGASCGAPYAGGQGGIGNSPCTTLSGSGGGGSIGCDAAQDLVVSKTLRAGSGGGGGGSGGDDNEPGSGQHSGGGGGGGGGGGAVRIVSGTKIVLGGSAAILANGGAGGNGGVSADDCNDDSGGGGGGGSGGVVWLQAPSLQLASGAQVAAVGGTGGAAGATSVAARGGNGGLGRIRLSIDPTLSSITGSASVVPPLPNLLTPAPAAAGKAYVAQYPQ